MDSGPTHGSSPPRPSPKLALAPPSPAAVRWRMRRTGVFRPPPSPLPSSLPPDAIERPRRRRSRSRGAACELLADASRLVPRTHVCVLPFSRRSFGRHRRAGSMQQDQHLSPAS